MQVTKACHPEALKGRKLTVSGTSNTLWMRSILHFLLPYCRALPHAAELPSHCSAMGAKLPPGCQVADAHLRGDGSGLIFTPLVVVVLAQAFGLVPAHLSPEQVRGRCSRRRRRRRWPRLPAPPACLPARPPASLPRHPSPRTNIARGAPPARPRMQVLAQGWCGVTDANSANSETTARWGGKLGPSQQTMRESAERCWPQLAAEAALLTRARGHLVVQGEDLGELLQRKAVGKLVLSPQEVAWVLAAQAVAGQHELVRARVRAAAEAGGGRDPCPTGSRVWGGLYLVRDSSRRVGLVTATEHMASAATGAGGKASGGAHPVGNTAIAGVQQPALLRREPEQPAAAAAAAAAAAGQQQPLGGGGGEAQRQQQQQQQQPLGAQLVGAGRLPDLHQLGLGSIARHLAAAGGCRRRRPRACPAPSCGPLWRACTSARANPPPPCPPLPLPLLQPGRPPAPTTPAPRRRARAPWASTAPRTSPRRSCPAAASRAGSAAATSRPPASPPSWRAARATGACARAA